MCQVADALCASERIRLMPDTGCMELCTILRSLTTTLPPQATMLRLAGIMC